MKRKFLSVLVAFAVLATCFVAVPASADAYTPKTDLSFTGLTLPEATTYYVDEDFNSADDAYSVTSITALSEGNGNKYADPGKYGAFLFSSGVLDCDKLVISVDTHSISNNKNDFVLINGDGKSFLYLQSWTKADTADIASAALIPYGINTEGKWATDTSRRIQIKGCKNMWGRYTFVFERKSDRAHLTQIRSVNNVYPCDMLINGLEWWNSSLANMKIKSNLEGGTMFDNIVVYGYKASGTTPDPEPEPEPDPVPTDSIVLNQYMPKSARDLIKWDFNTTKSVTDYTGGKINATKEVSIEDGVLSIPTAWTTVKFTNIPKIESDRLAIHFKVALGNYMKIVAPKVSQPLIFLQKSGNKINFDIYKADKSRLNLNYSSETFEGSGRDYMHTFDMVLKRVGDSAVFEAMYWDGIPIKYESSKNAIIGQPFCMNWWKTNTDGVFCFTEISKAGNYIDDLYVYVPEDVNVSSDATATATTVTLKNTSNAAVTGTALVAYYDANGKLIECVKTPAPITIAGYTYGSAFASQSATLSAKPANAKTMKVFYWNNFNDLIPLSTNYDVTFE